MHLDCGVKCVCCLTNCFQFFSINLWMVNGPFVLTYCSFLFVLNTIWFTFMLWLSSNLFFFWFRENIFVVFLLYHWVFLHIPYETNNLEIRWQGKEVLLPPSLCLLLCRETIADAASALSSHPLDTSEACFVVRFYQEHRGEGAGGCQYNFWADNCPSSQTRVTSHRWGLECKDLMEAERFEAKLTLSRL